MSEIVNDTRPERERREEGVRAVIRSCLTVEEALEALVTADYLPNAVLADTRQFVHLLRSRGDGLITAATYAAPAETGGVTIRMTEQLWNERAAALRRRWAEVTVSPIAVPRAGINQFFGPVAGFSNDVTVTFRGYRGRAPFGIPEGVGSIEETGGEVQIHPDGNITAPGITRTVERFPAKLCDVRDLAISWPSVLAAEELARVYRERAAQWCIDGAKPGPPRIAWEFLRGTAGTKLPIDESLRFPLGLRDRLRASFPGSAPQLTLAGPTARGALHLRDAELRGAWASKFPEEPNPFEPLTAMNDLGLHLVKFDPLAGTNMVLLFPTSKET